jgi:hypothetical protein
MIVLAVVVGRQGVGSTDCRAWLIPKQHFPNVILQFLKYPTNPGSMPFGGRDCHA